MVNVFYWHITLTSSCQLCWCNFLCTAHASISINKTRSCFDRSPRISLIKSTCSSTDVLFIQPNLKGLSCYKMYCNVQSVFGLSSSHPTRHVPTTIKLKGRVFTIWFSSSWDLLGIIYDGLTDETGCLDLKLAE